MSGALAPVLPSPSTTVGHTVPAPADDAATHRSLTARVDGGLDGALRVVAMLRGRHYRVRHLGLDLREGAAASRITCTAVLTRPELDLLLARLRRLPAVVAVEPV